MIIVGQLYRVKGIEVKKNEHNETMSKVLVIDPNFGKPFVVNLIVMGRVVANVNDPIVVGKIHGVACNSWSRKLNRYLKAPMVFCDLTGVNVIPN